MALDALELEVELALVGLELELEAEEELEVWVTGMIFVAPLSVALCPVSAPSPAAEDEPVF